MPKNAAGLGRGLAALLGESSTGPTEMAATNEAEEGLDRPGDHKAAPPVGDGPVSEEAGATEEAINELPVASVRPNPRQPRRNFDPEALGELARSIASTGIVQPIIVRPQGSGSYELIAGERRWRAAQMAGYTVVPAIVREMSDVESLEVSLIENVVRQQLNPMDEAFALHVLLEDLGVTQESLAERVGKSRSALANKVRLLDLPGEVQTLLVEGQLSEGHGRALLAVASRGDQLRLARRAVKEGLSVRKVEGEARKLAEGGGKAASTEPRVPAQLLETVRERVYGALEVVPKLRLTAEGQRGRIELPFRDLDELERILARLEGESTSVQ